LDRIRFLFAAKKDYSELAVFCKNKEARKPLKKILASKGVARVAVAKSGNGEIVGKALLYVLPWTARKNSSRAIIAEVFVREGYRNKGIATRLVKFCIKQAKKSACDVQIDRVEPQNKVAVRIYKKIFPKKKIVFST